MIIGHIIFILCIGIIAGFLNTVAGGGSLITMPVLIFLGLPSAVANGTNRVALMIQNITAVMTFRSKGFFDWKLSIMLGIPAALGAIIGSNIAVFLPDDIFNKLLAIVMMAVLILILWNPREKLKSNKENLDKKDKMIAIIIFTVIGIYGGLIQAGIGFIIIAALAFIGGFSLVKINSLKVFIVLIYQIFSLGVFMFHGKINWIYGLGLAIGNGIGGYLGSSFSVKKGDKWIKVILVITVFIMSAKLFGVFEF